MEKLPEKNRDVIGVPDGLLIRPALFGTSTTSTTS